MSCESGKHDWHKTGMHHPMLIPIYFYHCSICDGVGKARDGEDVVWTAQSYPEDRKWCRQCVDSASPEMSTSGGV